MSQLFAWGGQIIGVSASASVLPIHNNFIRLYCDSSHISVHILKKTSVNFHVAILILKMEENIFRILYYFKKGKNATETQRFVQFMKLPWLLKYVKSSLWSFMLEISCWMMLHSQVEVVKNQIETLIENNKRYAT